MVLNKEMASLNLILDNLPFMLTLEGICNFVISIMVQYRESTMSTILCDHTRGVSYWVDRIVEQESYLSGWWLTYPSETY